MGRSILLVSVFASFFFASGPFMQPIYYTDQVQRSLDSFFFRKRLPPKICAEDMEDGEK